MQSAEINNCNKIPQQRRHKNLGKCQMTGRAVYTWFYESAAIPQVYWSVPQAIVKLTILIVVCKQQFSFNICA